MSLKLQINEATKQALLNGDSVKVGALRNFKAVILNDEVSKNKRDQGLSDVEVQTLLQREIKKLEESARIYMDANRPELAENELFEASVLKEYLPAQVSEEEIMAELKKIASSGNLTSPKDMGHLIGEGKNKFGASADGATIAKIAKQILNI